MFCPNSNALAILFYFFNLQTSTPRWTVGPLDRMGGVVDRVKSFSSMNYPSSITAAASRCLYVLITTWMLVGIHNGLLCVILNMAHIV
jgi:hypothetical protein